MNKRKKGRIKDKFLVFYKKHRKISLCTIVLGSCLGMFFLINFGRYVKLIVHNYITKTQEFYFNSDKLTEDFKEFQYNFWSGGTPYDINIGMNSLDNSLKGADIDIVYDISCEAEAGVYCNLSTDQSIILTNSNTDSFVVTVGPDYSRVFEEGDSVSVTVTAKTTKPYEKVLGAVFTFVVGSKDVTYKIEDVASQPYFNVLITNSLETYKVQENITGFTAGASISVDEYNKLSDADKAKCISSTITITFDPALVRLDMTNTNYLNKLGKTTVVYDGYDYVNSFKFNVGAQSSTIVKFYKMDVRKDYTYPFTNATSIIDVNIEKG